MTGTAKVGRVDEIPPGKIKAVAANRKKVILANIGGKIYAMGSVCTHVGGPLEEGKLEGSVVTCPWHGSKFDITNGKVVRGPATNPEPVYSLRIEGNDILIEA